MSAADPREGDPRFDLSLLAEVRAALVPLVDAIDAAQVPPPDYAPQAERPHWFHIERCECDDCAPFGEDMHAVADAHHDAAREHQEERAAHGFDAGAVAYPDPCPLALIARSGVAERRGARYARTPAATTAARRAEVWS